MAKRKQAAKTSKLAKPPKPSKASAAIIQCWTTDPLGGTPPIQVAAPDLASKRLGVRIVDVTPAPRAAIYNVGTSEFRFWTAAEALRRGADFWSRFAGVKWQAEIPDALPVRLNDGIDLNAYYSRNDFPAQNINQGLSFFHDTVTDAVTGRATVVYSGESPDVVVHELGHAVLDAVKPQLWGLATTEAAAVHEGMGDVSSILVALQLPTVAQAVLQETNSRLWRNSSVSRLAEQLGWAIRQRSPRSVDVDSLRNAANSFSYVNPVTLPPSGPATQLSREPHNFSRVFSGAVLETLGGMVLLLDQHPGVDEVVQASQDLGKLLVQAIRKAPLRARLFQAVAEQLIIADHDLFGGKYTAAISAAMLRRGLISLHTMAPAAPLAAAAGGALAMARAAAALKGGVDAMGNVQAGAESASRVSLPGALLGLASPLIVEGPAIDDSSVPSGLGFAATAATPMGSSAVASFVETLVVRGRIAMEEKVARVAPLVAMARPMEGAITRHRPTHRLVEADEGLELQRITFECGH